MDKLIIEIGELMQDIEIARTFVHGLKSDITTLNYSNAVSNYKKLNAILIDTNKKMTKLKHTMSDLEKVVNGIQE
jgi:hypothetical protein